jgi:hypothetical protein
MQNPDLSSLPDLTDAQIQKLLEGVDLANEYYGEGGYDRETWNQICDACCLITHRQLSSLC